MRIHTDARRDAFCDLFNTPGDVNLFIVQPGQRTCWHRHGKQTDQFRVLRGSVRIQCFNGWMRSDDTLSSPEQLVVVPPDWWHGYENVGSEPAYLLMYLDQKYDPTDEERLSEEEMPWLPT